MGLDYRIHLTPENPFDTPIHPMPTALDWGAGGAALAHGSGRGFMRSEERTFHERKRSRHGPEKKEEVRINAKRKKTAKDEKGKFALLSSSFFAPLRLSLRLCVNSLSFERIAGSDPGGERLLTDVVIRGLVYAGPTSPPPPGPFSCFPIFRRQAKTAAFAMNLLNIQKGKTTCGSY